MLSKSELQKMAKTNTNPTYLDFKEIAKSHLEAISELAEYHKLGTPESIAADLTELNKYKSLVVNHKCLECGFEGEVKRFISCPKCGVKNDVWLENEEVPQIHKDLAELAELRKAREEGRILPKIKPGDIIWVWGAENTPAQAELSCYIVSKEGGIEAEVYCDDEKYSYRYDADKIYATKAEAEKVRGA